MTIKGNKVGINEPSPEYALHINESTSNIGLVIESEEDSPTLGANLTLFRHRGGDVSSQDGDLLSLFSFAGRNDASVPEQISYASILASITDATNGSESGRLSFQVEHEGSAETVVRITGDHVDLERNPVLPSRKPTSSTDAGDRGEVTWDENYVYICIDTNLWKRMPLSNF